MPLILVNAFFGIIAGVVFYTTVVFLLEKTSTAIIACLFIPTLVPLVLGIVDTNIHLNILK